MNPIWVVFLYLVFVFILSEIGLRYFGVPKPRKIPEPTGLLREEE